MTGPLGRWARRGLLCAVYAAELFFALAFWRVADYCQNIPADYWYYGEEALAELQGKGFIWAAVQGALLLLWSVLCVFITRKMGKKRKNGNIERKAL